MRFVEKSILSETVEFHGEESKFQRYNKANLIQETSFRENLMLLEEDSGVSKNTMGKSTRVCKGKICRAVTLGS